MSYNREESRRYAKENIARICAEQGLTVAITDPELIARSAAMLRVGKERADAARIEERAAKQHRVHKNRRDMRL